MKTLTYFALALLVCMTGISQSLWAQGGFSYQAVARDGSGQLMQNERIDVAFFILEGSTTGSDVYSEEHNNVRTNDYGLFTLEIGTGTNTTGNMDAVNWASETYFLEVEIDGTSMGTSKINGVPYAMKAMDMGMEDLTDVNLSGAASGDVLSFDGTEWKAAPDQVDDADANALNEIQLLSISGTTLSLSNGGGSVVLPAGGTDTDWIEAGSNVYRTTGNVGIGTTSPSSPLTIESSASSNTLRINHPGAVPSGKDMIELQVGSGANGQFIEMQNGTSVVSSVNTDGDALFKSVRTTEVVTTQTPGLGTVYANSLPVAYGAVSGTTMLSDYGITTVTSPSTGVYHITLNRSLVDDPAVIVTAYNSSANDEVATYSWSSSTANRIVVNISTGTGTATSSNFSFVVFGRTQ